MIENHYKCDALEGNINKAINLSKLATESIREGTKRKFNLIWLEANGCSGNIISLLDSSRPDVSYFLSNMVNMTYNNSLMAKQGEAAFQSFIDTLDSEFILVVEGSIPLKADGRYSIVANYKGKDVTAKEAVNLAKDKARYILAVGICASFGGVSAAYPNPSKSVSVQEFLGKEVINLPGCPCNPYWFIGTIAHIIEKGLPELDSLNRPLEFYSQTIHDRCPRRVYFEKKIFAKALGDKECMLRLGCRGPVTRADCPLTQWNDQSSWPIGINTPCIGCANPNFPDKMEPFINC